MYTFEIEEDENMKFNTWSSKLDTVYMATSVSSLPYRLCRPFDGP